MPDIARAGPMPVVGLPTRTIGGAL